MVLRQRGETVFTGAAGFVHGARFAMPALALRERIQRERQDAL